MRLLSSESAFRALLALILVVLAGELVSSGLLASSARDGAGPATFPIIGLVVTAGGLAAATLTAWRRPASPASADSETASTLAALLMAAFAIIFIHAVMRVGLVTTTAIALPILAIASGARGPAQVSIVTVVGTLLVWLLFGVLLDVFLPPPLLF